MTEKLIGTVNKKTAEVVRIAIFPEFKYLPRKGKMYISVSTNIDRILGKKDFKLRVLGHGLFEVYEL